MSKERISFFDNAVITIRMSGIPIVLIIIGVGFAIMEKSNEITIPIINCNGAAVPFIFAALYTIPLFSLDLLHYELLLRAVNHAKNIEKSPTFNNYLSISKNLTSSRLTNLHSFSTVALYATIFILCMLLAWAFWNGIPPSLIQNQTITNSSLIP